MWYEDKIRWLTGCVLIMVILAMGAAAFADVTVDPATIVFKSAKDRFVLKLTSNGRPVPANDIKEWRFLAADHDYKHMIRCEKKTGILEVAPSPTMEVGTYDFQIDTKGGTAKVAVTVSLAEEKDYVQTVAEKKGESREQAQKDLGLSKINQRNTVSITLPATFQVGQTLTLTMPRIEKHLYSWTMNGKLVQSGPDKNTFNYTFLKEGEYELNYSEKIGDVTVSNATAQTKVIAPPKTTSP